MNVPITQNADRYALIMMITFKELLNDLIQQHGRLQPYVLANTMISVAHELMASAALPQQFAPNVPDEAANPKQPTA